MGGWSDFALMFLGVCVFLAGVGMWFAVADKDWQYAYNYQTEEFPRYEGNLGYYDSLPPEQRAIVDRALEGEAPRTEGADEMPPPVVKRDDSYYVFRRYSYFDWTNPRTGATVVTGLVGLAMMVTAGYRDVHRRGIR